PAAIQSSIVDGADDFDEKDSARWDSQKDMERMEYGQVGGIIVDPNGAVVAGANVTVTNKQNGASQTTRSDGEGHWIVSSVQPGAVEVTIDSQGFARTQQELTTSGKPVHLGTTLTVGSVSATVNVTSGAEISEGKNRRLEDQAKKAQQAQLTAPSANVFNLQRRVAGILPVRVDVPRSGKSYRFVRPLVMDEETKISFQYKAR